MKTIKKLMKSYVFNIALVIFFTGFVLWLTLKDNFNEIMGMLSKVQIGWFLVVLFLVILYQVIIGWILKKLTVLSNPHYKWSQGIVNSFVASFFHGVTPSASGGQFAQVYIFKKQGVDLTDAASILWMDFIIYQATMVVSVLILILLKFQYFFANFSQFFLLVLLGFLINGVIIVGLWALVTFPKLYRWITTKGIQIGHKLHIVKDEAKALENLNGQLERFAKETYKLKTHKKTIIQSTLANALRMLVYYSIPFFCAKALNIEVGMSDMLNILALSSFVSMINCFIPIPGASGGTEATFVLMFSTLFGTISATSMMILWRVMTYYFIMILGGIVFIYAKSRPDIEIKDYKKEEIE
ncbi:MAG: YbhN family protein [Anaerorhabdus sp.]